MPNAYATGQLEGTLYSNICWVSHRWWAPLGAGDWAVNMQMKPQIPKARRVLTIGKCWPWGKNISVSTSLKVLVSHVRLFVTPWTVAHQAPLSMGILQARILEWIAMPFSRRSSWPRDWTHVSCFAGFFTVWATRGTLPHWLSNNQAGVWKNFWNVTHLTGSLDLESQRLGLELTFRELSFQPYLQWSRSGFFR